MPVKIAGSSPLRYFDNAPADLILNAIKTNWDNTVLDTSKITWQQSGEHVKSDKECSIRVEQIIGFDDDEISLGARLNERDELFNIIIEYHEVNTTVKYQAVPTLLWSVLSYIRRYIRENGTTMCASHGIKWIRFAQNREDRPTTDIRGWFKVNYLITVRYYEIITA